MPAIDLRQHLAFECNPFRHCLDHKVQTRRQVTRALDPLHAMADLLQLKLSQLAPLDT